jgi:hypothetical protein
MAKHIVYENDAAIIFRISIYPRNISDEHIYTFYKTKPH